MNRGTVDRIASRLASVERFLSEDVARFKERLAELHSEIDDNAVPERNDSFHQRLADAFLESQQACARFEAENSDDPVVIRDVQEGFRKETARWFNLSWIGQRARSKPNGFAGDYEMLIKLYEQKTPARGFGGYLDLCILELPLARAVRARLLAARDFLRNELTDRKGDVRILDIACGPCFEYLQWTDPRSEGNVEIVAMDNDPRALEFVQTNIASQTDGRTKLLPVRYNALRTRSADATTRKYGKFDIIYSVGLFDYLTDEQLIPILSGLRDTLQDNGVMYIAFKDANEYEKSPYQWHLDWHFYQRQLSDCVRLYESAGFNTELMETTRDGTGIIINFITRRPRTTFVRVDLPEDVISRIGGHHTPSANPASPE